MTEELKFGELKSVGKSFLDVAQALVEFNVEGRDGKNIKRILSIVADPKILSTDAMMGEVVINGRVNYKALYLTEDDEIMSLDYFSDYKDRISNESIVPESRLAVKTSVLDVSYAESGERIAVTLVLENRIELQSQVVIPALKQVTEGFFDERKTALTMSYADSTPHVMELAGQESVGGSVAKILMFDTHAAVKDVVSGSGVIRVDGQLYSSILLLTGEGAYVFKNINIEFSEELAAPHGLNIISYADAEVKSSKIVLIGSEEDPVLRVEAFVALNPTIVSLDEEEVIADVFSIDRQINVVKSKTKTEKFALAFNHTERVDGQAVLDDSAPAFGEVLAVMGARNSVAALSVEHTRWSAEGILNMSVLYKDVDDIISSTNVEIPYSLSGSEAGLMSDMRCEGIASIGEVSVRRRKDRELEVNAEVILNLRVYDTQVISVVAEIEDLGERQMTGGAISIFNAETNETLWDIAKALGCTPDEVVRQNPDIVFPMSGNTKVVLYRELAT